jgi:cysteine desulfurase
MVEEKERVKGLRDNLLSRIRQDIPQIKVNGHPENRLFNNIHLSIEHIEGESLLMQLDMEGIAASSGSACSSGSDEPSHVLAALGLSPELARGSLRLSLGRFNTQEEVDYVAQTFPNMVQHLQSLSPFAKENS